MPKVGRPTKSATSTNASNQQRQESKAIPERLRAYIGHGLDLQWRDGDKEALSDCPFCGADHKFSVNIKTGQWRCLVCAIGTDKGGGNLLVFLRCLWQESDKATTVTDYKNLAKGRKLQNPDTLISWKACKSIITGKWLLPGYGVGKDGELVIKQLYRYSKNQEGKMVLLPTPTLTLEMFGLDLYKHNKEIVYLCEGPWDAMRLWEVLGSTKPNPSNEDEFVATGSVGSSFLADANVLAVPGCNNMMESWIPWFKGKCIYLMFDNDYPKKLDDGRTIDPPALTGMRRTTGLIGPGAEEIHYLQWGEAGYDDQLPNHYDLRDALAADEGLAKDPHSSLKAVSQRIATVPDEWLRNIRVGVTASGDTLECRPCNSYRQLTTAWRKALKWTPGLDHALAVMLASAASTRSVGDQLWIKIIGPASCGKSTLCEALAVNRRYTLSKSTVRGFHTGFKIDAKGEEDCSLVALVANKTLITKDGDTLLQSPNLGQILSEARDLYDGTSRTHYRTAIARDYQGIRMTWLLCGTSSLRSIDNSELGERFLDCVIMEGIDPELEDEISWRSVNRAERNTGIESDESAHTHYDPATVDAYELTGGYLDYLRTHMIEALPKIVCSDWAKRMCVTLGRFVAYMRARPSNRQEESAERELAVRLSNQHVRLAKFLAYVLNRSSVDKHVMQRLRRVSLDTARGSTLKLVKLLLEHRQQGLTFRGIAMYVADTRQERDMQRSIMFLSEIGIIERTNPGHRHLVGIKWRLTSNIIQLYNDIVEDANWIED